MRGRPRLAAQRPLPSMMMATWAGALSVRSSGAMAAGRRGSAAMASMHALHVHDLLFLGGEHGIDLFNRLVGRLLHLLFLAALLVLAHGAVLLELLQEIDPVAPHVADGDAG